MAGPKPSIALIKHRPAPPPLPPPDYILRQCDKVTVNMKGMQVQVVDIFRQSTNAYLERNGDSAMQDEIVGHGFTLPQRHGKPCRFELAEAIRAQGGIAITYSR